MHFYSYGIHSLIRYLQHYKAETTAFTTWLVNQAKEVGYEVLRRQTKHKAGDKHESGARYQFPTSELPACASAIVSCASRKIKIPESYFGCATSAIRLRAASAKFYQQKTHNHKDAQSQLGESNEGHSHFLEVLRKTLDILKPCWPRSFERREEDVPANEAFQNRFSKLSVEDICTNDDADQAATLEIPKPDRDEDVYELDTSDDDMYFAIFCLFEDLAYIRWHIGWLWTGVKDQRNDIVSVSVVTTAALELCQRLEAEILTLYPQLKSYEQILIALLSTLVGPDSVQSPIKMELGNDCFQMNALFWQWAMLEMIQLMRNLEDLGPTHLYQFACESEKAELQRLEAMSSLKLQHSANADHKKLFAQDLQSLFILVAELELIRGQDKKYAVPDRLAEIWWQYQDDKSSGGSPSVSLICGLRMYLDIHNILGKTCNRGLNSIIAERKSANSAHQYCAEFEQVNAGETERTALLSCLGWILSDVSEDRKKWTLERWSLSHMIAEKRTSYRLFRNHPVRCGMLLLQFRTLSHLVALRKMNLQASLSILAMSHLYNAARHQGILNKPCKEWPDLELIIANTGERQIFVGDRPSNLTDYLRRMMLSYGMSATALASHTMAFMKQYSAQHLTSKSRKIAPLIPLIFSFWQGNPHLNECKIHSAEVFNAMMARSAHFNQNVEAQPLENLGPEQYLSCLHFYMKLEMRYLSFNLIDFDMLCEKTFKDLWTELQIDLEATGQETSGPGYILSGSIFAAEHHVMRAMGKNVGDDLIIGESMKKVAKVLDRVIDGEGSRHGTAWVRDYSKPKHETYPIPNDDLQHMARNGGKALPYGISTGWSHLPKIWQGTITYKHNVLFNGVKARLEEKQARARTIETSC